MNEELASYRAINSSKREDHNRFFATLWLSLILGLAIVSIFAAAVLSARPARAHEAMSVKGDPLGWVWPPECCNSAATTVNGDCATIDASTVQEKADGYHVTLRPGQHPRLKTKGYSTVVPYGLERSSPSGEYGICLATDGSHRYCFFAGAKGF